MTDTQLDENLEKQHGMNVDEAENQKATKTNKKREATKIM